MAVTLEAFGLDKLSADEKAELIGLLEESIAADDAPPLTPEQLAELERRIAHLDANPGDVVPWEVVRDAARARSQARWGS